MSPVERRAHSLIVAICAAAFVCMFGFEAGPEVEGTLFPIRADQRVVVIERTAQRVCWLWSSLKLRPAVSDNIDAFVIDATGDRSVVAPFARTTGMPWRVSGSAQAGPQAVAMCALLPPHVGADAAIRVEQTILYRGWRQLWSVPVRVPDVVSAGPVAVPPG